MSSLFGGSETTRTMSGAERDYNRLNVKLAKEQLKNIQTLQPFQKELLEMSLAEMRRQGEFDKAMSGAVSPEEQAAFARSEFERAQRLGPIQDQLLQAQLDAMHGKISPEQQAAIDAAIGAGEGDIDRATSKGIGLIADELANSRGLRLTDTPILREATLLAESGIEQKRGLSQNLRAQGMLQFPQISSGIALNQQNLAEATKAFQADLRQRAFNNRLSLTGTASQGGIGLSSIAAGRPSSYQVSQQQNPQIFESIGLGGVAGGLGKMMSDRRLKSNVVRVGTHRLGVGVYEYDLFGKRQRGVMADEVAMVKPDAVSRGADGYLRVDYGML